jgi:hypothetical protein
VAFVACATLLAVPGVSDMVSGGRCVTDVLHVSGVLGTSFGLRVGRRVISTGRLGGAAHLCKPMVILLTIRDVHVTRLGVMPEDSSR